MTKVVQVVALVVTLAVGVVVGVKYSEQLKAHFSWMSESKEDEIALPDLSNEEIDGAASGENQDVLTNAHKQPAEHSGEVVAPMDSAAPSEEAAKK